MNKRLKFKKLKMKSLKSKLVLCTVSIVILTAALNLVIGTFSSYQGLTQNVNSDLTSMGTILTESISHGLENMQTQLKSLAQSDEIGAAGLTEDQIINILDQDKDSLGYKTLSLVKTDGTIISKDSDLNNQNISDQVYFQSAAQGETYFSVPMNDPAGNFCIIACTPISSANFSGVLMATLDPYSYSPFIQDVVVGKTGSAFIIDKDGVLIGNISSQKIDDHKTAEVYKYADLTQSGITIYSYSTGDRICYHAPLPGTDGWSFGIVAPIAEMTASIHYTIIGLVSSSIFCIICAIVIALLAAKSIVNPITYVCRRLELLSVGDLHSETVDIHSDDETGILAESLNKTVLSLRGYIEEITNVLSEVSRGNMRIETQIEFDGDFLPIKESLENITKSLDASLISISQASEQIASGSEQVASGAQLLSQGATEQAASIEELSSTMEEIAENIKTNAKHAGQANEKVDDVRTQINESNQHMNDMLNAMAKIDQSSNEIEKIVKTIEDISFQTNILALNAAVEAARAGAAGKGFAVVADEVRNLAAKSAEAVKGTTLLINNSREQVEKGAVVANSTAKALQAVVASMEAVSDNVEQISKVSSQQSNKIEQVSLSVNQISNVVQTNSATAEESAAASEELSGQAQMLKELVAKFQL
ncbi:hypothetical protein SDC9_76566 [bioreactor metagenome]|uniref:Uncharacterized protein n=1 Tax=bioreactor metagenome TaxID=1076179 RepID=A0A644YVG8_9ZZZZ